MPPNVLERLGRETMFGVNYPVTPLRGKRPSGVAFRVPARQAVCGWVLLSGGTAAPHVRVELKATQTTAHARNGAELCHSRMARSRQCKGADLS